MTNAELEKELNELKEKYKNLKVRYDNMVILRTLSVIEKLD